LKEYLSRVTIAFTIESHCVRSLVGFFMLELTF